MKGEIPDIVIGRLPIYLRALNHLANEGKRTTSSHELGRRLDISSAQIRKDLSHFGEFGKQGTGYHIQYLTDQLRQILNIEKEWPVVLVGAGFLGQALAQYDGFADRGFRISWIFDKDPDIVGKTINGMVVQSVTEMKETLEPAGAKIAIISVPAHAAQETADMLIDAGIKSILNYAPINLLVPLNVHVQYSDPVTKMQQMSYYLHN